MQEQIDKIMNKKMSRKKFLALVGATFGGLWLAPKLASAKVWLKGDSTGIKIMPFVNSVNGVTIAQADGTDFVTFDTTNKRVGINNTAPTQSLDMVGKALFSFTQTDSVTNHRAFNFEAIHTVNNNVSPFWRDMANNLTLNVASGKTLGGEQYSHENFVTKSGVGTASSLVNFQATMWTAGGTVTNWRGYSLGSYGPDVAGTIGSLYGYNIQNLSVSGTVNNFYGFFLGTQTVTGTLTNRWGVYIQDNTFKNYFAGKIGLGSGITAPTALLHIAAGTATAGTAPLKFTSGVLNTAAEVGAVEYLTDDFYGTITTGAARKAFILDDGARLTSTKVPVAYTNGRLIDSSFYSDGSDNWWVGDGTGIPYGSFYGNEISFSTGALTAPQYVIIADTDCVQGEVNLTTYTDAGTTLTISKAGRYKIDWALSAESGTANTHILGGIMINSTTVLQAAGRNHFESTAAGRQVAMSGTAIIDCPNGSEVIGVGVGSDVDNVTITVDHVNLTITMVGGT
jgi:hypothetical protein